MVLLSDVAANLRAGANLPLPEVRRAAQEVDLASRRLAAALTEGHQPTSVRPLGAALEHLDSAAGALLLAQHAIQGYLASVDACPAPVPSTVDEPARPDWWVERVVELTGYRPPAVTTARGTSAEVLSEALTRAQDGDRGGLAEVLAGAGQSVGLGLAALTGPLVRRCTRLVDDPGAALATVRNLLPGLPRAVAETQLAGTPPRPWAHHPADPPIAGTVLVAGLLNLLGRNGSPDHRG